MSAAMRRAIVVVAAAIRLKSIRSLHLQVMARIELLAIPLSCLFGLVIEAWEGEPESARPGGTYPYPGTTQRATSSEPQTFRPKRPGRASRLVRRVLLGADVLDDVLA